MFEYSLLHWGAFLSAALLLNLSPGPDMAFILGQTVRGGRSAGFSALAGIWTGAFGHVLMAAAGLSAVLAASAVAFAAVKWAGAAYLIWLGIKALRSSGGGLTVDAAPPARLGAVYRQGIVVSLLNPKVAVFFLAFLPQFVVPGAGPLWAQLMLHGVLVIAAAAVVEPPLILAGGLLTARLRASPKIGLWLDRTLGGLLIALGLRLAVQDR
ncbi:LysE family translocator [Novispirillum itersonii]|uniref:LysE family translocator n=1 Tax=Novispirillum itersonii TaxID=189 RepID=UPI00036FDBB9|nr:LysE family translocator [Novispirillum itersonii]